MSCVQCCFPRDINDEEEISFKKVELKQESFYLLSFVSWLFPFEDVSKWEFRAGNNGIFAVVSCIFLFVQMTILFDLGKSFIIVVLIEFTYCTVTAYEEDQISYKCKGNSARLSVVVCGALVTLIVAMKMLPEERRSFAQRLMLVRHTTYFPLFESVRCLLFGNQRIRALKLLLCSIFQGFRQYGVIIFVYVAGIEQLMLFDTILDYIINSVVVLVIAELDELAFKCLARIEESTPHHLHDQDAHVPYGVLRNPISAEGREYHSVNSSHAIEQYLLKTEEGIQNEPTRIPVHSSTDESSTHANVLRQSLLQFHHSSPQNIQEMSTLRLSQREYEAYLTFDFWIVRCNFISMLLPLMNAKITGSNCGEHSLFRVSEIGMFAVMASRVLLNVYVDFILTRNKNKSFSDKLVHFLGSLFENALPCVAYIALMYLVFVEEFKPNQDDYLV